MIRNWLRSRSTVEFLGVWERLNNPAFNPVEFEGLRKQRINSRIQTDAIKDTLIPPTTTKERGRLAHILPLSETPTTETLKHPLPTVLIRQGLPQPERLTTLNDIPTTQMRTLLSASSIKRLTGTQKASNLAA